MTLARAAAVLALAACNTPTPSLHLALAGPPSQACPSTDCSEVALACAAVMNIQIIDPGDPKTKWVNECVDVPEEHGQNMCALDGINLPPTPIPVRDLEVQVALYPRSALATDAMNKPVCPDTIAFSEVNGFPQEQAPSDGPAPAVGGRAFYHPGDQTVQVTLGCTDLGAINNSCVLSDSVTVVSTVDEFDPPRQPVPMPMDQSAIANQLTVWVGEPRAPSSGMPFQLNNGDRNLLTLSGEPGDVVATWSEKLELQLIHYVCIEVDDGSAVSPAVLRCVLARPAAQLNLRGMWISNATIHRILSAIPQQLVESDTLPPQGITVGLVVNQSMNPVMGATIAASGGTVQYLNGNTLSGEATSASGIFVSRDAPFGTTFSVRGQVSSTAVGGLVQNKLTVVMLTIAGIDTGSAGAAGTD